MIFGAPGWFPVSLVRCLVSILTRGETSSSSSLTSGRQAGTRAGGGAGRDELWRSALAILCEVSRQKSVNLLNTLSTFYGLMVKGFVSF